MLHWQLTWNRAIRLVARSVLRTTDLLHFQVLVQMFSLFEWVSLLRLLLVHNKTSERRSISKDVWWVTNGSKKRHPLTHTSIFRLKTKLSSSMRLTGATKQNRVCMLFTVAVRKRVVDPLCWGGVRVLSDFGKQKASVERSLLFLGRHIHLRKLAIACSTATRNCLDQSKKGVAHW